MVGSCSSSRSVRPRRSNGSCSASARMRRCSSLPRSRHACASCTPRPPWHRLRGWERFALQRSTEHAGYRRVRGPERRGQRDSGVQRPGQAVDVLGHALLPPGSRRYEQKRSTALMTAGRSVAASTWARARSIAAMHRGTDNDALAGSRISRTASLRQTCDRPQPAAARAPRRTLSTPRTRAGSAAVLANARDKSQPLLGSASGSMLATSSRARAEPRR